MVMVVGAFPTVDLRAHWSDYLGYDSTFDCRRGNTGKDTSQK
jgi:hypothetical protein